MQTNLRGATGKDTNFLDGQGSMRLCIRAYTGLIIQVKVPHSEVRGLVGNPFGDGGNHVEHNRALLPQGGWEAWCILGGSWVVISGVISRVTIRITHIGGLISPLLTTHEPPSSPPLENVQSAR